MKIFTVNYIMPKPGVIFSGQRENMESCVAGHYLSKEDAEAHGQYLKDHQDEVNGGFCTIAGVGNSPVRVVYTGISEIEVLDKFTPPVG